MARIYPHVSRSRLLKRKTMKFIRAARVTVNPHNPLLSTMVERINAAKSDTVLIFLISILLRLKYLFKPQSVLIYLSDRSIYNNDGQ